MSVVNEAMKDGFDARKAEVEWIAGELDRIAGYPKLPPECVGRLFSAAALLREDVRLLGIFITALAMFSAKCDMSTEKTIAVLEDMKRLFDQGFTGKHIIETLQLKAAEVKARGIAPESPADPQ